MRELSPYFPHDIKIPRKLKKKMKKLSGVHWDGLTNGQRMWYCMNKKNRNEIIKRICDDYERRYSNR